MDIFYMKTIYVTVHYVKYKVKTFLSQYSVMFELFISFAASVGYL